jgi:hypothetical protein
MITCPLGRAGIVGDFGVEDENTGLQFGDVISDVRAMLFEQFAPLRFSRDTTVPKLRITKHVTDRHTRRF